MTDPSRPSAGTRWRGLVGLAASRAVVRAVHTERGQTLLSIAGVGVAIALMLLVTSIGVGLAQSQPVVDQGVDYTIEAAGGASSSVVEVGGARLGRVHDVSTRLNARDDVRYATPVLTSLVRLDPPDGDPQTVLVIGVIPPDEPRTIVGLPTTALTPGDPHYANGSYDGPWTGEAVVSTAAAERLGVARGDRLRPARSDENRTFTTSAVSPARQAGLGQFPVVVVHLSELQSVTGAAAGDVADQILVDADGDIEAELADIYPRSTVLTRGDLFGGGAGGSQLPMAISVAALIISVVVGTLFLMTTMGFELAAERRERAVMAAIGLSRRSRLALVVFQALVVSALGGVLGVGLWLVGLLVTNVVVASALDVASLGTFRPIFAAYGLGVALLIGVLTLPYLLVVSRRDDTTEWLPV